MAQRAYLAIDLGASSGRHVAGLFDGQRLELDEIHRFDNGPTPAAGHLYWDVLALWSHTVEGLRAAAASKHAGQIASVGVDTWGVDFALLGRGDELLANPVHYRDARTDGLLERAFEIVPRDRIFDETGLQFMQFNTLYQLWAMQLAGSSVLDSAERLLMMPDLFHWLLTGQKSNEQTNATTTQFFNPQTNAWSRDLLEQFEIPDRILADVVPPGTMLGPLTSQVAETTGSKAYQRGATGHARHGQRRGGRASRQSAGRAAQLVLHQLGHVVVDGRGSAAAGDQRRMPAAELYQRGRRRRHHAFAQEHCRIVARAGMPTRVAATGLRSQLGRSESSGNGRQAAGVHHRSGRRVVSGAGRHAGGHSRLLSADRPNDPGGQRSDYSLCAGEFGAALSDGALVAGATGRRPDRDDSRRGRWRHNRQLCQATADACQRRVLAGPVEATAIGNVMVQAIAAGDIGSIAEARQIVRASFALECYEPRNATGWEEAFGRFRKILSR